MTPPHRAASADTAWRDRPAPEPVLAATPRLGRVRCGRDDHAISRRARRPGGQRALSRGGRGRPAKGRAPERRSDRARTAVLHAADDLLVERGYAAVTIEGIAARAGVAKQTIYRWWPSLEGPVPAGAAPA